MTGVFDGVGGPPPGGAGPSALLLSEPPRWTAAVLLVSGASPTGTKRFLPPTGTITLEGSIKRNKEIKTLNLLVLNFDVSPPPDRLLGHVTCSTARGSAPWRRRGGGSPPTWGAELISDQLGASPPPGRRRAAFLVSNSSENLLWD